MGKSEFSRHGIIRAVPAIVLAGLVAACAGGPSNPAPVVMRGTAPPGYGEGGPMPPPGAMAGAEARRIVVERGQSLGGIAHAYHVGEREIIAANHLTPPYKIETGQHLLIPGGGRSQGRRPWPPPRPQRRPPRRWRKAVRRPRSSRSMVRRQPNHSRRHRGWPA